MDPSAQDSGLTELREVPFGAVGDWPLLMDIVLPAPMPSQAVPAMVLLHGGGWARGDRSDMLSRARLVARHGYVGATVGYRLAGKAPFPAQLHDCKCAVRYLRANAASYGIDPGRLGVWGCSAGGHLASLLGLTAGLTEFEGDGGLPEVSSAVQLVIDCFGPSDFPTWQETVNKLARDPVARRLFGSSGPDKNLGWQDQFALDTDPGIVAFFAGDSRQDTRWASPIAYAQRRKPMPPILVVHGTRDTWVPMQQSLLLAEALDAGGIDVTVLIKPNMGHDETAAFPDILEYIARRFDSMRGCIVRLETLQARHPIPGGSHTVHRRQSRWPPGARQRGQFRQFDERRATFDNIHVFAAVFLPWQGHANSPNFPSSKPPRTSRCKNAANARPNGDCGRLIFASRHT